MSVSLDKTSTRSY